MSRILFGAIPFWAHINPTIGVALKLQERGHQVAYICHQSMEEAVTKAGIPYLPQCQWNEALVFVHSHIATHPHTWAKMLEETHGVKQGDIYLAQLEEAVRDCLAIIDEWQPDSCVFDMMFFPGIMAAEIRNIPYATSCPTPMPLPSKDTLPVGFGFPVNQKKTFIVRLAIFLVNSHIKKMLKKLNLIRSRFHLPPRMHYMNAASPYLYLCYTTNAFERTRSDLPPQVFYVGPSVSKAMVGADMEFPWEWLQGQRVVYFSLGTVFARPDVIRQVIMAAQGAPWKMVVSIGKNLRTDQFTDLPPNVLLRNYVPQVALLDKVQLVVSSGGLGTISQTLMFGLPILVLPQAADDFDVAQIAVEAQFGLRIDPKQVSPEKVRHAIDELLHNPNYAYHAERVAADFRKCDAPLTAALLVEKMTLQRKPLLRPAFIGPTVYKKDIETVLESVQ
ncbi:hypothetical protein KTO58_01570 [Chitinophaga pendula]|uniref:glycosyltransferase n=1 Tax=Chitinophaga TaxID=79328 RepID=UPI000BAF8B3B|nr:MULTISPECIES: nucleotide disphospho-sugar-binding domain-containing protein [Chitinophaga]ASZ14450.1 hypothetical protein CK934_27650 [Chitinophaga sp. MD30]UCJ07894.1 hypothetical protein KTO58_01570 [Chitinophaga pendula]